VKRSLRLWVSFGLGLVLALLAMGWITHSTLRMEQADAEKQQRIELDSRTRIALWRMESMASSLVALESSRPWFHFSAFHEARLSDIGSSLSRQGDTKVPSPLLIAEEPHIFIHFQVDTAGHWSSPQVPEPQQGPLVRHLKLDPQALEKAQARLREIEGKLTPKGIREALFHRGVVVTREQFQGSSVPPFGQGACATFWGGEDLFLARQVWIGGDEYLQGCWIDWAATRQALLSTVLDLLPDADLIPVPATESTPELRRSNTLSSLSVRFVPGKLPPVQLSPRPPIRRALAIGWTCTLLAFFSGALVLHRTIQLGERRMAFASAVTHELRTPLTTLRLYSGLLANGMVTDEAEQKMFLQTLASEADRLDHLIKNVLSFARLEARPNPNTLEPQELAVMLDRIQPQLLQRTQQAGLELVLDIAQPLCEVRIPTDPALVEQILLNLADNACKYAATTTITDRRLHVEARRQGAWVLLRCRDHGPGLDAESRQSLFKPFGRSSRRAALGMPGVGLGLALCRRLARGLGGDLRHDASITDGACFELRLPVCKAAPKAMA